jgi:hypothetical protein
VAIRVHGRNDQRALFDARKLGVGRASDFEKNIGFAEDLPGFGKARAGALVVGVGYARLEAGAALDDDFRAKADEFLDRLRRRRDARLRRIDLGYNPDELGSHLEGMRAGARDMWAPAKARSAKKQCRRGRAG